MVFNRPSWLPKSMAMNGSEWTGELQSESSVSQMLGVFGNTLCELYGHYYLGCVKYKHAGRTLLPGTLPFSPPWVEALWQNCTV